MTYSLRAIWFDNIEEFNKCRFTLDFIDKYIKRARTIKDNLSRKEAKIALRESYSNYDKSIIQDIIYLSGQFKVIAVYDNGQLKRYILIFIY